MIYKTLTVATFGLLAWQTVQLSNYREETTRVNYQLEMVLQDINHIDEVSGESQTLFKKQMESQEKLEKALLEQSEVLAGLGGGDAKSKGGKKKKAAPPKPKKLSEKEADELVKKLAKIEALQKNKKKAEAVKALDEFKKAIWKLTKRTNVGKAKVLSISSSLDVVLKNWKSSDKAYPVTLVKNKIIAINTPEKVKAKPAPAKPAAKKKKPKAAAAKPADKKGKAPAGKSKAAAKPKKADKPKKEAKAKKDTKPKKEAKAKKDSKPKKEAKAKKDAKPKKEAKAKKDSKPKKDGSKKESAKNMIQIVESEDQTS